MSIVKDVSVRLSALGASDVKAQLTSITEQANRLGSRDVVIDIAAKDDDWEADADKILAEAKELGATKVRINVSADSEDASAKMDIIRVKADELGLKKVSIKVQVDTAEAEAKLSAFKALSDAIGSSSLGEGFSSIGEGVLPAAAATAIIGMGPTVLAGTAVGLGAITAAASAAAGGMGIFGAAAYGAITRVTAANTANQKLKGSLGLLQASLKDATSDWHGFIDDTAGAVAGPLSKALGLIPDALNMAEPVVKTFGAALSSLLTKNTGGLMTGLDHVLSFVQAKGPAALDAFAKAIGSVIVGVGGIIKAFAPFQGTVLGVLDKGASSFAKWGQGLGKSSGFESMIAMLKKDGPEVGTIFKNLGSALKNVVTSGFFGGSSLAIWKGVSSALAAIASHPVGADALAGLLILGRVFPLLKGAGQIAIGIKDIAESEKAAAAASALWDLAMGPIGLAIIAIGIAVVLVATHFKFFKGVALDVWHAIEDAGKAVWNWLKQNWPLLLGILLGPFGEVIGIVIKFHSQITSVIGSVVNWIRGKWDALMGILSGPFKSLSKVVSGAFDSVKNAVVSGFDGWWKSHGAEVKQLWGEVWDGAKTVFTDVWNGILAVAKGVWKALTDDFNMIKGVVLGVWHAIWSPLSGILKADWNIITGIIKDAWSVITAIFHAVLTGLITVVKGAWDAIKTGFTAAWDILGGVIKAAWDGVVEIFKIALDLIETSVKVAWDILVGIIDVVLDLLTGHIGKAWTDIKNTAQQVWNAISGFFKSTWNTIKSTFTSAWNSIESGLKSAWDTIYSFLKGMPGKILSALGNVGKLLWNAGKAIIEGLLGGIKQAFDDVKNFIGGIGSWISSHKGPISYDATLLVPHGRAIMGGLVTGLNDGMPGLNQQLAKTTSAIAHSGVGTSGGTPNLNVQIGGGGNDDLTTALVKVIRNNIRVNFGGDAQRWASGR